MKKCSAVLIPALVAGTLWVLPVQAQECATPTAPATTQESAPTAATSTTTQGPEATTPPETAVNTVYGEPGVMEIMPKTIRWEQLTEKQKQLLEGFLAQEPELRDLVTKGDLQIVDENGSFGVWLFLSKEKNGVSANLRLFFDSKGHLQEYHVSYLPWASEKKPSDQVARQKADAFARYALGDELANYQMEGSFVGSMSSSSIGSKDDKGNWVTWTSASVLYNRLIKGIVLSGGDGIQISVDGAGHVVGFNRMNFEGKEAPPLDETAFPDPSQALSPEKAKEIYASQLQMKLLYYSQFPVKIPVEGEPLETRSVLAYSGMNEENGPIDALTGNPAKQLYGAPNPTEPQLIEVSGANQQWKAKSLSEAASLINQLTGVDMAGLEGKEETEIYKNPYNNNERRFTWQSPVLKNDGKPIKESPMDRKFIHVSATVDKKTGRLSNFSIFDSSQDQGEVKIKEADARQRALEFLQQSLPYGTAQLQLSSINGPGMDDIPPWVDRSKLTEVYSPKEYSYFFRETHQGVPVVDRGYMVAVSAITGKVISWSGETSEKPPLPDKAKAVSPEIAKAEFLKNHSLQLTYIWPDYMGQKAPKPSLVYMPKYNQELGNSYIDALTGQTVKAPRK